MTPDAIERAALLLAEARRARRRIPALPADCAPRTVDEGYAVQDRLIEILGEPLRGWSCACTNPEIQARLGLDGPYSARVLESTLHESPAAFSWAEFASPPILEVEFSFRLGRDLPARAWPYSREEVVDAIATVHPSIEIVNGHLDNWPDQPIASIIADNGVDGRLIYGGGVAEWRATDLAALAVMLTVNGDVVREGTGANVLGDPLAAFVWLANQRAIKGDGLRAGHLHNTGTATSMYDARPDDDAVADFGPLGQARLTIGG